METELNKPQQKLDNSHKILFGLRVQSELILPGLIPTADGETDLWIEHKQFETPTFRVQQVGAFQIPDAEHIYFDGTNPDALQPFLLGTAMGIALQKRGYLLLHGNAVIRDGRCLVFIGHSGAGKSTLTALALKAGYQVLTDDVCAIDCKAKPTVIPSYPEIKLWEDSALALGYDTTRLKPLLQRSNKYVVSLDNQFYSKPAPINQIFVLNESTSQNPYSTLKSLIQHTYRHRFIESPEERARHLAQCLTLTKTIPIQSLSRPPLHGDANSFHHWVSSSLF